MPSTNWPNSRRSIVFVVGRTWTPNFMAGPPCGCRLSAIGYRQRVMLQPRYQLSLVTVTRASSIRATGLVIQSGGGQKRWAEVVTPSRLSNGVAAFARPGEGVVEQAVMPLPCISGSTWQ
jgi:hypothetical protein